MENLFYIPIKSENLGHYFGGGIILPAKYFSNKPNDIQNIFNDSILLTKNKWVSNSDCSIEVILTEKETEQLNQVSDNFFTLHNAIPISRIRYIFFLKEDQKIITVYNINKGAGFIPNELISVESSSILNLISTEELESVTRGDTTVDLSEKIKKFDKILGAFAFMRLGGKPIMNYSFNYFATLSYFNELIDQQTKNAANRLNLNFSNKYWGLFSKNIEGEWTQWLPFISKDISPDEIISIAKSKNLHAEKNNLGTLKLDSIDSSTHLFDLAVLATYGEGEGKSKSVDDLVTDLFNGKIIPDKIEDISILFGLNLGYSKLYNKYKTINDEYQVKFDLQSKLDYYTIESLFQFVFNGIKSNSTFDYIDKWCLFNTKSNRYKDYETYTIIDVNVVAKKKQSVLDFFFENYSASIYSSVVKSINNWLPPFAEINEKGATKYFENNLRNILGASVEAIQSKIKSEFDEQYNLLKTETIESHKKEINKLLGEISLLKQENENLNKEILSFSTLKPLPQVIIEKEYAIEDTALEAIDLTSIVQEPETEYSVNYDSMSFPELQNFAKENKVKGYTTCKSKEDLVTQIKKAQKVKEAQKRQPPLL